MDKVLISADLKNGRLKISKSELGNTSDFKPSSHVFIAVVASETYNTIYDRLNNLAVDTLSTRYLTLWSDNDMTVKSHGMQESPPSIKMYPGVWGMAYYPYELMPIVKHLLKLNGYIDTEIITPEPQY